MQVSWLMLPKLHPDASFTTIVRLLSPHAVELCPVTPCADQPMVIPD
jgi:hypothetical protein